ncbi:MAG: hypothetical protein MHM6MM_003614 [Cercozoa sp. M6MM]
MCVMRRVAQRASHRHVRAMAKVPSVHISDLSDDQLLKSAQPPPNLRLRESVEDMFLGGNKAPVRRVANDVEVEELLDEAVPSSVKMAPAHPWTKDYGSFADELPERSGSLPERQAWELVDDAREQQNSEFVRMREADALRSRFIDDEGEHYGMVESLDSSQLPETFDVQGEEAEEQSDSPFTATTQFLTNQFVRYLKWQPSAAATLRPFEFAAPVGICPFCWVNNMEHLASNAQLRRRWELLHSRTFHWPEEASVRWRVDFTNVELLNNFVNDRGMILPSRVSGCCGKHQTRLAKTIKTSRNMGFMHKLTKLQIAPPSGGITATQQQLYAVARDVSAELSAATAATDDSAPYGDLPKIVTVQESEQKQPDTLDASDEEQLNYGGEENGKSSEYVQFHDD